MRCTWVWGLLAVACARPQAPPTLSWRFEARPTHGEVRVMPVIAMHAAPELDRSSYTGRDLTPEVEAVRKERTRELGEVPEAIGLALPGAVNGLLGQTWEGQFRYADWPMGAREHVELVLEQPLRNIDRALGKAARLSGGEAVLVTWVTALEGRALTSETYPGGTVETGAGPAVVDHSDEPYHLEVDVGMALVAADGEVVLRYEDRFEALLSERMPPEYVGRVVATELAGEVGKVWATEEALRSRERVVHRQQ